MDFRDELAKYGYNKGNSIDVEILIDEILPNLFDKFKQKNYIVSIMKSDEELGLYNDYGPSTFIKPDNIDGEWLSPIPSERIIQEEKLVQIFEHYPTAAPRWQYMNALIQNGLQKLYNEDEVLDLLYKHVEDMLYGEKTTLEEWFEKNKKI